MLAAPVQLVLWLLRSEGVTPSLSTRTSKHAIQGEGDPLHPPVCRVVRSNSLTVGAASSEVFSLVIALRSSSQSVRSSAVGASSCILRTCLHAQSPLGREASSIGAERSPEVPRAKNTRRACQLEAFPIFLHLGNEIIMSVSENTFSFSHCLCFTHLRSEPARFPKPARLRWQGVSGKDEHEGDVPQLPRCHVRQASLAHRLPMRSKQTQEVGQFPRRRTSQSQHLVLRTKPPLPALVLVCERNRGAPPTSMQ